MIEHEWVKSFAGAVVVCDPEGIVLEMNDSALHLYRNVGGAKLLGTNMHDCHPDPARTALKEVMKKRAPNVYSIERKGSKMLVYQAPWHVDGEYRGFVQLIMPVPFAVPHYSRDKKR